MLLNKGYLLSLVLLFSYVNSQLILTSPEFKNFESIPPMYCCDMILRDDLRPSIPLNWTRPPVKTQSYILIMDDIDNNGFVHWLVKDIPREVTSLAADASESNMPAGSVELLTSRGFDSYSGPCPLNEEHNYRFRLFAMPSRTTHIARIENPDMLRSDDIVSQIQEEALVVAVLVGKFYLPEYIPPKTNTTIGNSTIGNTTNNNTTNNVVIVENPRRQRLLNSTSSNTTAPALPRPTRRFVKPSEVIKPQRPHNTRAISFNTDCTLSENRLTPECIINEIKAKIERSENSSASNLTRAQHFTQYLVSQKMKSFRNEIDSWSCEEEYRRNAGVRIVDGETETCSMRVRVTDAPCEKRFYPQQFTCQEHIPVVRGMDKNHTANMSPSLDWKDAPAETKSFIVLVEDSSPPPFIEDYEKVYWLVTDIPPSTTSIVGGASGKAGQMPPLSIEINNSFGKKGYTPPCPGKHDVREYRVRLFAMPHTNTKLFIGKDFRSSAVIQQLQKQALCMSTIELPFSYRMSFITESTHHQSETQTQTQNTNNNNSVAPGEIVVDNV